MKMKRLLALLLAFVMCFMLVACGKTTEKTASKEEKKQTAENATATPLLYRVTDQKGNVVWLFGSIHVGREDYYPLPDYVMNAFANADSLAVELDIVAFEKNLSAQTQALGKLAYTDGTTIKDHIPQALYDEAVGLLKKGRVYSTALDMYPPAFWGSLLEALVAEEVGGDAKLGIDRYLIDQAYESKKVIINIESAEFQYQMMADFDDEVQRLLLESGIDTYENTTEAAASMKMLMDLWASGDEEAFNTYLNTDDPTMPADEKAAYERYYQAMFTDRNIHMADYAESALRSGKEVFICVGAAHVVGDGAMADLLARRGYTVERVFETKPAEKPSATNKNGTELIAYVDTSLTTAEARALGTKIHQIDGVYSARFVSGEERFQAFLGDHGDEDAFAGVDADLLPAAYYITLEDNTKANTVIKQLKQIPGITEVTQSI